MKLDNQGQAFILGLSAFFLALGTYTAAIPDVVTADIRVPISVFFWICGVIGFALKEALGSTKPQLSSVQSENRLDSQSNKITAIANRVAELEKTHPQTEPPLLVETTEKNPT